MEKIIIKIKNYAFLLSTLGLGMYVVVTSSNRALVGLSTGDHKGVLIDVLLIIMMIVCMVLVTVLFNVLNKENI